MADDYLRHEALDRASLIAQMIGSHLAEHPFIQAHATLRNKVFMAGKLLGDVYQTIGAEHLVTAPKAYDDWYTNAMRLIEDLSFARYCEHKEGAAAVERFNQLWKEVDAHLGQRPGAAS